MLIVRTVEELVARHRMMRDLLDQQIEHKVWTAEEFKKNPEELLAAMEKLQQTDWRFVDELTNEEAKLLVSQFDEKELTKDFSKKTRAGLPLEKFRHPSVYYKNLALNAILKLESPKQ